MSISVVNGKCVFPQVDKKNDKRITITDEEIAKMKKLRKKGLSYDKISQLVNRQRNVVKAYLIRTYSKQFAVWTGKVQKRRYKSDERFRTMLKQAVNDNQKIRYKNDIEYRIYQCCHGRCKEITKRYGSLEKYREFRLKCYALEIDPSISKEQYKVLALQLRRKYRK